ncbi:Pycsar system effector family protein [Sediminibacterium ginsengisoli]|uniref:HD domain-containing protein n=1 Tax=Sediminibacterium ginsengisoli TaxID=413434 RepID=A0A1T4RKU7_9BACT|nr:Pycsar system effector family protein [Sediminibacterium ginsengisoli]SKA16602.1 HD domain-containing protein [Sediminibacterium ginsengisoli]
MNYQALLDEVKAHTLSFFNARQDNLHVYHNLSHTTDVVKAATQIANHYQLNDRDFFIVLTAAWFHDTGYLAGEAKGHEEKGAELAAAFLQERGFDAEGIQAVKNCILATRLPQQPHTLNERIVCDADLFHLGTDDFIDRNKLMRKEVEAIYHVQITKDDFRAKTISLFESHHYHTDYCQLLLNDKKEQNLQRLKAKAAAAGNKDAPATAPASLLAAETAARTSKKSDRPERGIETMFRISSNNHQRLSDMADNKAHIMITTTSIIISVLLSVMIRKLEEFPHLTIPVILLLGVCVITMVFSILATRPTLTGGTFTPADIAEKKVNLLFFGNFYKMTLEEYDQGMQQLMADRDFLYGNLIRDVHSQGIVLGRKYRLLRIAYNVFMFGIVISVVSFLIASIFFR